MPGTGMRGRGVFARGARRSPREASSRPRDAQTPTSKEERARDHSSFGLVASPSPRCAFWFRRTIFSRVAFRGRPDETRLHPFGLGAGSAPPRDSGGVARSISTSRPSAARGASFQNAARASLTWEGGRAGGLGNRLCIRFLRCRLVSTASRTMAKSQRFDKRASVACVVRLWQPGGFARGHKMRPDRTATRRPRGSGRFFARLRTGVTAVSGMASETGGED